MHQFPFQFNPCAYSKSVEFASGCMKDFAKSRARHGAFVFKMGLNEISLRRLAMLCFISAVIPVVTNEGKRDEGQRQGQGRHA